MAKTKKHWKRGRGKLGMLAPLIGSWKATASTPIGPVACTRVFEPVLSGNYIRLTARWDFGKGVYEEVAMIGVNPAGTVAFWSFSSDGKNSNGTVADVTDIHPEASGLRLRCRTRANGILADGADGFHWSVG
jgi:hypothetical protein